MSTMLMDFDGRMQRAVQQQESRTLTTSISGQSKNRRGRNIRLASIVTLIVFLLVVVGVIIFLQAYNSLQQQYDHRLADMLRLTEEQVAADEAAQRDVLVISTQLGDIRVVLRPDLSAGSVDYIRTLVQSNKCDRCSFYRADGRGILQGIMKNKEIATNTELGPCPPGYESVKNDCPAWDKNCSCHGPIMERGAVAWAAGQAGGPDFFIDNYRVSESCLSSSKRVGDFVLHIAIFSVWRKFTDC